MFIDTLNNLYNKYQVTLWLIEGKRHSNFSKGTSAESWTL